MSELFEQVINANKMLDDSKGSFFVTVQRTLSRLDKWEFTRLANEKDFLAYSFYYDLFIIVSSRNNQVYIGKYSMRGNNQMFDNALVCFSSDFSKGDFNLEVSNAMAAIYGFVVDENKKKELKKEEEDINKKRQEFEKEQERLENLVVSLNQK